MQVLSPSSSGATGFNISHFPRSAEHAHVIEDRRKKDAESQKDFNDILYVTKEKTGCRNNHADTDAKENRGGNSTGTQRR